MEKAFQGKDKEWVKAIARSWIDEEFKDKLLSEPKTVLKEAGIEFPENIKLDLTEAKEEEINLTLLLEPGGLSGSMEDLQERTQAISQCVFCRVCDEIRHSLPPDNALTGELQTRNHEGHNARCCREPDCRPLWQRLFAASGRHALTRRTGRMRKYSLPVGIEAAPEYVFRIMTTLEKIKIWEPSHKLPFTSHDWSQKEGNLQVGCVLRVKSVPWTFVARCVGITDNEVRWDFINGPLQGTERWCGVYKEDGPAAWPAK